MGFSFKKKSAVKSNQNNTPENTTPTQVMNQKTRANTIKVPVYIHLLKVVSIIVLLGSILASTYLKLDLDPENKYLGILGYKDNTETKYKTLKGQHSQKTVQKGQLVNRKKDLNTKIKEENFSEYTAQIQEIRSKQITWFDTFDNQKNFRIGLFNIPDHLANYVNNYVNKQKQNNPLGNNNRIEVENVTANRTSLSFSFEASNLYGKVFFLTNEFVHLVNSLPTLQGIQISSFTRTKNDAGLDSMSFSVNAKIQQETDTDTFDDENQYQKFLQWVEQQASGSKKTTTSPSPRTNRGLKRN